MKWRRHFNAPLNVFVVRKLGGPGREELAKECFPRDVFRQQAKKVLDENVSVSSALPCQR